MAKNQYSIGRAAKRCRRPPSGSAGRSNSAGLAAREPCAGNIVVAAKLCHTLAESQAQEQLTAGRKPSYFMARARLDMLNPMPSPPAMRSLLVIATLLWAASPRPGRAQSARRAGGSAPKLAFTFDDLPAHGPLPPGETRMGVIAKIAAALRQAKVPPTYGFVNAEWTEQEPSKIAVLRAWRDAGNPLGNHSWSHMNLDAHPLGAFEGDIARNEALLSGLMKNADWHWFRFPFLVEGDTPEKKNGVRAYLGRHGYKIAGVTMSFGDYMWNEPYARCKTKNDTKSIRLLEDTYLRAAKDAADYSRELSHRLFHRDIPYVLLMHVGAFDAEMLLRLL